MSDRFSAASEGSTSASSGRVCELCGSASRTTTADESSLDIGPESRATPMCAPLWPTPGRLDADFISTKDPEARAASGKQVMLSHAVKLSRCPCRCHRSMSSAAASPAKTSQSPAREQGSTEPARVFGPSTHDSLASFDPDTSSWRTSQLSLLGGLDEFSGTWPRSGMTRNGTAYQRAPLAPLTGGTASGLLPTPAANPAGWQNIEVVDRDGNPPTHANQRWYDKATGRVVQKDLRHVVERGMWPTPRTSDTNGRWSTPKAQDAKHAAPTEWEQENRPNDLHVQAGGQLNPTFVEFLMGFPKDWTEVE